MPIPILMRATRAAGDRQPNPNSNRSQKRLRKKMRLLEKTASIGEGADAEVDTGDETSSLPSDPIALGSSVVDSSALPPPVPGRCHFFIWGKNRYCRQMLPANAPAVLLCAEHRLPQNGAPENKSDRIPCPYDPKHTVDTRLMRKHLLCCNSRPLPTPPYIVKGVNSGRPPNEPSLFSSENAKQLTAREKLQSLSPEEFDRLADKIRRMYAFVPPRAKEVMTHVVGKHLKGTAHLSKHPVQQTSLVGHLANLDALGRDNIFVEFGAGRAELSLFVREAVGDPSTFAAVDRSNFKRKIDHLIQRPYPPPPVLSTFHRVKADIADLDLTKYVIWLASGGPEKEEGRPPQPSRWAKRKAETVEEMGDSRKHKVLEDLSSEGSFVKQTTEKVLERNDVENVANPTSTTNSLLEPSHLPPVVAFSKHLCGIATDLTLRSLAAHRARGGKIRGILVALCCHQLCSTYAYCRPTITPESEEVFDDVEFPLVAIITTWAVCGAPVDDYNLPGAVDEEDGGNDNDFGCAVEEEDVGHGPHWSRLTYSERRELGLQAKRVLDWGRVRWLHEQGFEGARLVEYVDQDASLENVA
ncbi:tRNA:m(4)X modification enzyme TRM13, partial [Gonapodya sp. JEL0774]